MATVNGLTNYYSALVSPLKSYQVNPITNLVYGSAVSKLYAQSIAKNARASISTYLSSMNSEISSIKTSAKTLGFQRTDSTFNKKTVTTTDSTAVTGTANWNADAGSHTITVSKLAESQTNKGKELKNSEPAIFNQGLNTFTIKTEKNTKTAVFSVNPNDTNKSALNKMATAINSSNSGLTASVVSDSKAGTSYLKLNSNETGTNNAFSLIDTINDSVSASGANTIENNAQNAEYTLDAKKYTSQSNAIDTFYGKAQLTLKKADNKEISFTIGNDITSMESSIKNFVKNYNEIIKLANGYSDNLQGAEVLGTTFSSMMAYRKNTLSNIGITFNSDNTLQIDDKKLANALNSNIPYVKDIFSGYNGIGQKIYNSANDVLSYPKKYSSTNPTSSLLTNYYSSLFNTGSSTNSSDSYSGMLLDMLL